MAEEAPKRDFGSMDDVKSRLQGYSLSEDRYRPDLYPTTYCFSLDGHSVTVAPLRGRIFDMEVKYKKMPTGTYQQILEQESETPGWQPVETDDPRFKKQFPLFNPKDIRNKMYVTDNGQFVALVQRDVADVELSLWIHSSDYWDWLEQYRNDQK
jgi:hypothetical protein